MEEDSVKTRLIWLRLCFMLSPEDSSADTVHLPAWATPCCLWIKTILWVGVSIATAVLIGQL